jgi:PIN domain nuclease of toxin-antitoxin system
MGCDEMIVLDTHVLIWSQFDKKQLGKKSLALIERRWQAGEIAIPSIAFWEVGLLVERSRLKLTVPLYEWRRLLLDGGAVEFSLSGEVAIRALDFTALHADPADRLIAATAVVNDASLMTADEKLLAWRHPLERHDARL